jgi:hypothetical protein
MPDEKQGQQHSTLRGFGFTEACEHPHGSVAYDRGEQHCPFCGAVRIGVDEWKDGSLDYKIDAIELRLVGDKLKSNLQGEQSS